jgi:cellulose synthase/poly-beta-1,6-N-acetylglucosamine synthase-like glycosyltransferase/peptidoglycan/xylan/chitin deacetylase (PgdA/CDA1 family)
MQHLSVKIMPMLTNFNSTKSPIPDFDGALIHDILNSEQKQNLFIKQLIDTLQFYKFSGINIDFEEITENTNIPLANFQSKLYNTLHLLNLTVTQDVAALNNDYDLNQLSKTNDYLVLMAYDQYNSLETGAGTIANQAWIEKAVDAAAKEVDNDKLILGIAAYGYDWVTTTDQNGETENEVNPLTYSEAMDLANISQAKIIFDNQSYNLHFTFTKKNNEEKNKTSTHNIWFTDAATTFNTLRFSDEYGLAGTALWRMGSEDPRIWSFYNLDLDDESLKKQPFNFNSLINIPINTNQKPTAVGEGEILNIITSPNEGLVKLEIDSTDYLITEQEYTQLPSGYIYERRGEDTTEVGPGHKLVLTFDDGPSSEFTPKILDILEKEKVPATFFIVGLAAENNIPILKRIYKNGYEIGNHTFTHHNIATMSPERASLELKTTRLLIETITGRSTILFRAPYNADSEPQTYEEIEPLARSKKDNYITVGESIDPNDWDVNTTADSIVAKTIQQTEERKAHIILLHDAGGETRKNTVEALPRIIEYFKAKGCQFTTVADLMHKTKDDVMPLAKADWKNKTDGLFFTAFFWISNLIFSLFLVGIFLSIFRTLAMAVLAYIQKRKEKTALMTAPILPVNLPLVSIIVPAYNEEVNAVRTVNSLLQQDYKNLEVVFVDDGSKDSTYTVVKNVFANNALVNVLTKQNGGKASALNIGIQNAKGKYVVCIDADTQLKEDAVTQLMNVFFNNSNQNIGAVAGNVKVGNEINMITNWQSIEYITSQNFDRRAFDLLNCITVVPGAIGAFNKDAIIKAGGFTSDTLAEDCDLTMRLHRNNYIVKNCTTAISYTEAPETLKQFLKQRFRWSFGVMQCFWKHRDAFLRRKYKTLGFVALPNILIYQIILPFLSPLADLVLVTSLIMAALNIIPISATHIVLYYVVFQLVDIAGAALAFSFEKESYKKLWWMLPQRFIYRQLMYYILIKSINKALKGELQGWGVLKRTGNVNKQAI